MKYKYYVYFMSNKRHGTLYVGVTNDLVRRTYEHRHSIYGGFTKKYMLIKLVYYEVFDDIYTALSREKQLKNWKRIWKIALIETMNPQWEDLSCCFLDCGSAPAMTEGRYPQ